MSHLGRGFYGTAHPPQVAIFSPPLPDIVATATEDESPGCQLGGFPQGARPTRLLELVHLVNWFATIDLMDVYFHIEVAPKHRKFHPAKLVLHPSRLAFAISCKMSNPYLSKRWSIWGLCSTHTAAKSYCWNPDDVIVAAMSAAVAGHYIIGTDCWRSLWGSKSLDAATSSRTTIGLLHMQRLQR